MAISGASHAWSNTSIHPLTARQDGVEDISTAYARLTLNVCTLVLPPEHAVPGSLSF